LGFEAQDLSPGLASLLLFFFIFFFQKKLKVKKMRHTNTPVTPFVMVCLV